MTVAEQLASSEELGSLGVAHLKRFWSAQMFAHSGVASRMLQQEWIFDHLLLDGLGLGLEATYQFLAGSKPSFAEFEQWVRQHNGGNVARERIERVNAAVLGGAAPDSWRQRVREIDAYPPVLDADQLAHWDEHGYVVVPQAITLEACRASAKALWEYLRMDEHDPETWYGRAVGKGIMTEFVHHPALQANRDALRVHKAFAQLWKSADLWVTTDRTSINVPERSDRRFPGPHLHWDVSLTQPIPLGTQGLIYLTDTAAEQGAFTCVPGFAHRICEWLASLPPDADPRQQDMQALGALPIPGKAGDLIIWHQALPHGSRPNRTALPRLVHYVAMYPTWREHSPIWR